ncbi:MAG: MaoC family dehydratase [Cytophagales bacterium]|nr:MaoC family dehydratase [Cytophagales bacterium]
MEVGDSYTISFSYTQDQVAQFAHVTGDDNPIHLDETFAAQTPFKKPIIHGFLGGSIFSKVLGTLFPGKGSIYIRQSMEFLRPMFVDQEYRADFKILSINTDKHRAVISTEVFDKVTGKITIKGEAEMMNTEKL